MKGPRHNCQGLLSDKRVAVRYGLPFLRLQVWRRARCLELEDVEERLKDGGRHSKAGACANELGCQCSGCEHVGVQ